MAQQKIFGITIGKADKPKTFQDLPTPTTNWKPSLPGINALPIELVEKQQNSLLIKKFAVGAAATAVAITFLFVGSNIAGAIHDSEIKALELESTDLTVKIAALKPYQTYKDNINTQMTTLYEQLKDDVDASRVLQNVIQKAEANNIQLSDINLTVSDGGTNTCPGTDPFDKTTVSIGCMTFTGLQDSSSPDATNFLNDLRNTESVSDVFINTYTNSGTTENPDAGKSFDVTLNFGNLYYSNKYADLSTGVEALINAASTPPAETTPATTTEGNNE